MKRAKRGLFSILWLILTESLLCSCLVEVNGGSKKHSTSLRGEWDV
jgi:hypothetical protein